MPVKPALSPDRENDVSAAAAARAAMSSILGDGPRTIHPPSEGRASLVRVLRGSSRRDARPISTAQRAMSEPVLPAKANVDYRLLRHWTESRRIHRANVSSAPVRRFTGLHPALVEGTRRVGMPLEDR